jgi:Skp family chaperone for outer membrane proteins
MTSGWKQRTMIVTAAAVLIGIGGTLSSRFAATFAAPETEVPKVPATTVAVMDIAYIFKNHKAFKDEMTGLEQKGQAFQQNMAATQAQLQLLKARMEQTEDKAEKEKLEVELASQSTDFQISVRKAQQDISDKEASLYYETYTLLQEETKKYCRSKGIHMVLKTMRDPIKPNDRKSIMEGLNRPIVFSDAPDISEDILKVLDAAAQVKAAARAKTEGKTR